MPAAAVSADGEHIFLALENASGHQLIATASRDDLSLWSAAYSPGAGSAANVAQVPGDADKMLFYGNFGTDVCVLLHTISGPTNTDISPASLGAKVVNCLAVNPSNSDEIIITVSDDQDLLYTDDGGDTWNTLNATLGYAPTAMTVIWGGSGEPHTVYLAGNDGMDTILSFSPNDGDTLSDIAGATLVNVANVAGLEVGY